MTDFEHISKPIRRIMDILMAVYAGDDFDAAIERKLRQLGIRADKVKTIYGVVSDAEWLYTIQAELGEKRPEATSADAWTLRRRQFYFAKMLRRLLQ